MKPLLVLSGVNLVDFGPLEIYRQALESLVRLYGDRFDIVALVHDRHLFDTPGVDYREFPQVKSSWLGRITFEYFTSYHLSLALRPKCWIALHDITPRVACNTQYVYCHNPSPFYRFRLKEALLDPKFGAFTLLYRFLYRVLLHANKAVIVQQDWIRTEFAERYGVETVIVAHPAKVPDPPSSPRRVKHSVNGVYRFFYPAYPRTFKNHDLLFRAAAILEKRAPGSFELLVTLDGGENRYAAQLYKRYCALHSIKWLGGLSRERVSTIYDAASCLLFPSKLETWGLPLTEFKATNKPILAINLPYAHETIGNYGTVRFFEPDDSELLATLMEEAINGTLSWEPVDWPKPAAPFAKDWTELWRMLFDSPCEIPPENAIRERIR